jgi:rubrerythrin
MVNCTKKKPEKTIENLKTAYNGESTASAKYAKYAEKAMQEGYPDIARMFQAFSKSESVHAGNHKKVLDKLGEKIGDPVIGSFEVKTTRENLTDGINGESYESSTMYPDFIKVAEQEKSDDAKKSYTWAMDTEKKHKAFAQNALQNLDTADHNSMIKWYVCPVCGNTYDEPTMKDKCDFCKTTKDKFIVF